MKMACFEAIRSLEDFINTAELWYLGIFFGKYTSRKFEDFQFLTCLQAETISGLIFKTTLVTLLREGVFTDHGVPSICFPHK